MSTKFTVNLKYAKLKQALTRYAISRGLQGLPSLALVAISDYIRRKKPDDSMTELLHWMVGDYSQVEDEEPFDENNLPY